MFQVETSQLQFNVTDFKVAVRGEVAETKITRMSLALNRARALRSLKCIQMKLIKSWTGMLKTRWNWVLQLQRVIVIVKRL